MNLNRDVYVVARAAVAVVIGILGTRYLHSPCIGKGDRGGTENIDGATRTVGVSRRGSRPGTWAGRPQIALHTGPR